MDKRNYRPVVSTERLNAIMQLLLFRTMTIAEICEGIGLCERLVSDYLQSLEFAGKISYTRPPNGKRGGSHRHYSLVPGAMPFPTVEPKNPPRRPRVTERKRTGPKPKADAPLPYAGAKRGPKPGTKKSVAAETPKIKIIPAQNLGMRRDPLVAALFG